MARYGMAGRAVRNPMLNPGAGAGQAAQMAGSGIMSAMPALSTLGDAFADAMGPTLQAAGSGIGTELGGMLGSVAPGLGTALGSIGGGTLGGLGGTIGGAAAVPLTKALGRMGTGALGSALSGMGGVMSGNPSPGRDMGMMAQGMAGSMPRNPMGGVGMPKVAEAFSHFTVEDPGESSPGMAEAKMPEVAQPGGMDIEANADDVMFGQPKVAQHQRVMSRPSMPGADRMRFGSTTLASGGMPKPSWNKPVSDGSLDAFTDALDSGMSQRSSPADALREAGMDDWGKKTPPSFRPKPPPEMFPRKRSQGWS